MLLFCRVLDARLQPVKVARTGEVNPDKKVATFGKHFLCTLMDQSVHLFFSFPTNIFSNKKICYKIIFINSHLSFKFIYNDFLKIPTQYCQKFKEIGGHHEEKLG